MSKSRSSINSRLTPLLSLASLLFAAGAQADILFDQMTNPTTSVLASSWYPPDGFDSDTYAYDNFLLPSSSTITEVWWIGGGVPITGLTVRFYTGLASSPDFQPTITALPESENSADYLAGYTFSGDGNQTAIAGSSLYQYHVVLPTPLHLPGNTVFWIKIEDDAAYLGPSWGVAIASHGRDSRHISYYTGLAQFLAGPGSEAFQLRGTPDCTAPMITTQPTPAAVCGTNSGSVHFSAASSGTGPLTYSWRKGTVPINATTNPSAATSSLTLTNVQQSDAGLYDCVITNACGSATTNAAALSICLADFNCDAAVDFFDYLDFVDAFSASASTADFNHDGAIDFFDYLDFVDAFSTGC